MAFSRNLMKLSDP